MKESYSTVWLGSLQMRGRAAFKEEGLLAETLVSVVKSWVNVQGDVAGGAEQGRRES